MARNHKNREARSQKPETRIGKRSPSSGFLGFWLLASFLCTFMSLWLFAATRPPLVDAAKNGDRDALRTLLQKGADVNSAEGDGATALHWASYKDDIESASL